MIVENVVRQLVSRTSKEISLVELQDLLRTLSILLEKDDRLLIK